MKFIEKKYFGKTHKLAIHLANYANDSNLYVGLLEVDDKGNIIEPFADITVNLNPFPDAQPASLKEESRYVACVDINNFPDGQKILEDYNFGTKTKGYTKSGFVTYPWYLIYPDRMKDYVVLDERNDERTKLERKYK